MNDNLYSNGLQVSGRELANNSERIRELLANFQQANVNFRMHMNELKTYWSGSDYDSMRTNINLKMDPVTADDGTVQTLMKNMISELEQKASDYNNIQRNNESYWG